jgi:hypothetical protein
MWNGSSWRAVGARGVLDWVTSLAVYNGDLIAAGGLTEAGGVPVNFIARWDGTAWTPLGIGTDSGILCMTVYNGELIVGGGFSTAGGVPSSCIARWNGTSWNSLGTGVGGWVYALGVWNGLLFAGGEFGSAGGAPARHIAQWDGTSWSQPGGGVDGYVQGLTSYAGDLIVVGGIYEAGGVPVNMVARWNGTSYSSLGSGVTTVSVPYLGLTAVTVYDGKLVVGGIFTHAGGSPANNIAQWDGSTWSALGMGAEVAGWGYTYPEVHDLIEYNGDLIAMGPFSLAGGVPVNGLARWDGTSWSSLGSGTDGFPDALAVLGQQLYVGGYFTTAGGKPSLNIASWMDPFSSAVGAGDPAARLPVQLAAHPSPFAEGTTLAFEVARAGAVRLTVHDVRGALVRTLAEEIGGPGQQTIWWDGLDERGMEVPRGVYYARVATAEGVGRQKVVKVR